MTALATFQSVVPPEVRRAAETRLAMLRQKLAEARAAKQERMRELKAKCREDRLEVRRLVREMRSRSITDLRAHVSAARAAAKVVRLTRLAEAKQASGSEVDRWRAATAVERQHEDELRRIARDEEARLREIHEAHERSLAAGAIRSALLGTLGPLFEREVAQVPGESRAEAVLRHGEQNPDKVHAVVHARAELAIAETARAIEEAENTVRAVGGNVAVRAASPPAPAKPSSARTTAPKPRAPKSPSKPRAKAPKSRKGGSKRPAAPQVASGKQSGASKSPPKTPLAPAAPKSLSASPPKKATNHSKAKPTGEVKPKNPATRTPGLGPKPRKRRLGEIPQGGMLLEDFLKENAVRATKKAARGSRGGKRATTLASSPKAPAPLPSDSPPRATKSAAGPATKGRPPAVVTSTVADVVRPYKVRASCGHIVVRPMRPATAGIPFSESVVLDAPHGRACDDCEAKKNHGPHAPGPAAEHAVKAPEERDTAKIAAHIRGDIAEAVRTKGLPRAKYAVRTSKYSMGSSIRVVASGLPFPVLNAAAFHLEGPYVAFNRDKFQSRYTAQAETVHAKLESIVKSYHWDKSDLMTDYFHSRFHYEVELDEGQEFKRIEEALKRGSTPPDSPAPADLSRKPQSKTARPTTGSRATPKGTQQSLTLDAPLLHGAPKRPAAVVIPFPTRGAAPVAGESQRKKDLEALEAMALPGGALHGAKLEAIRPLLERARTLTPAPGESRTQALWRYARAHPEEIRALIEGERQTRPARPETKTKPPNSASPSSTGADCEPRYQVGEIVESKSGVRAEIEGSAPTECGFTYRVVHSVASGDRVHDVWSGETILRAVPKGSREEPSTPRAPNAYEQKQLARVERLRAGAEKLRAKAQGAFSRERAIASAIPMGQPILVGHHSERRHRRDIGRMHTLANQGVQLTKEAEALERRARSAEASSAISSDDPEAIAKLRAKADAIAKERERMRSVNAVIRKGGSDVVTKLAALGFSEGAAKGLLEKDVMGRVGFPDYKLTNTSAEERRLRERIKELERRDSQPTPPPEVIGDATVTQADNRVRISFPSKPPEALRSALKGAGFRWAPSEGVWQRFASTAAWVDARRILRVPEATPPTPVPSTPLPSSPKEDS